MYRKPPQSTFKGIFVIYDSFFNNVHTLQEAVGVGVNLEAVIYEYCDGRSHKIVTERI